MIRFIIDVWFLFGFRCFFFDHKYVWHYGYGMVKLGYGGYDFEECEICLKASGRIKNFKRDVGE